MKIELSPKKLVLPAYVALSLCYIAYTLFIGFRDGMLRNAYESGRSDTVKALLEKTADGKCEAVNVFAGDKKADLIDVACLKKSETAAQMPAPTQPSAQMPALPPLPAPVK